MEHVRTPGDAGQNPSTDPSLVDVLEKNVRALVRMSAALLRLAERLTVVEGALADDGVDEPDDEPEGVDDEPRTDRAPKSAEVIPPLALLADGRVAIHLSEVEDVDLGDRERWTGTVLTEAETADVLSHLSHGMSEAAGLVGGWIAKAAKKRDEEGES